MSEEQPGFALPEERQDTPLYEQMKSEIKARIERGEWPTNHRIPSENELVELLGVSRMTAHRALRELASEGVIIRVQGRGSFVAPKKRSASVADVRSIADEIAERGGLHSAELVLKQAEVCDHDLADRLSIGGRLFDQFDQQYFLYQHIKDFRALHDAQLVMGDDQTGRWAQSERSLAQWNKLGVQRLNNTELPKRDINAALVLPDGEGGRAFLAYDNYKVLMHWNRSYYFVTSVGYLADLIVAAE